jgi:hypothetical protein
MSDQTQTIPLLAGQRQERESDAAVVACNDYLRMGSGRSLSRLVAGYRGRTVGDPLAEKPPTQRLPTLEEWSSKFEWQARASTYNAEQDQAKTIEIQRLKTEGLAAEHNRIAELDAMFSKMREEFIEKGLWAEDIKISPNGMQVKVKVFNKPMIDSMRGILDDIAKEVGGRKQQINQTNTNIDYDALTDEQLERIKKGEDPAKVVLS